MTLLADQVRAAQFEAARLQNQLENCQHAWTESVPAIGVRTFPRDEATGGGSCWVLEQKRTCSKCGLHQAKAKYNPDSEWSNWST